MNIPRSACLIVVMSGLTATAHSEAADLAEAIAALDRWEQTIESIRVRARMTLAAEPVSALSATADSPYLEEVDWLWEASGRFRDEAMTWRGDRLESQRLRLADYQNYYDLGSGSYLNRTKFPRGARVALNHPGNTSRRPFFGQSLYVLWDDATRTWLAHRLRNVQRAEPTPEGQLQFDGGDVGLWPGTIVRLDPGRGYLPVEAIQADLQRYRVEEFRELQPGFWFPGQATVTQVYNDMTTVSCWDALQIDLNLEYPESLFVPPLHNDTRVSSYLALDPYRYGDRVPAHPDWPTVGQAPPAEPFRTTNWPVWLSAVAACSMAFGIWIRGKFGQPPVKGLLDKPVA